MRNTSISNTKSNTFHLHTEEQEPVKILSDNDTFKSRRETLVVIKTPKKIAIIRDRAKLRPQTKFPFSLELEFPSASKFGGNTVARNTSAVFV